MSEHWIYGAIGVLLVLHVVALVRAYRNGQVEAETSWRPETEVSVDEDSIECPDCGTHNEKRYRYCRQCVDKLPTDASIGTPTSTPLERPRL